MMSNSELDARRERLLDQVFAARTLPQIDLAKQSLRTWLREHPDELGMADAFEALSHFEDYALQQQEDLSLSEPVIAAPVA